MDVIYNLGEASVADVLKRMPDEPAYNTVRNTMAILERKGHLRHRKSQQRYLYVPANPVDEAQRSAVGHLMDTFFGGSPSKAVLALLGAADQRLSRRDLDEIATFIAQARKEVR